MLDRTLYDPHKRAFDLSAEEEASHQRWLDNLASQGKPAQGQERRCSDCGALVSDEHIALAAETGQAPYCPDCWGESLVLVEGAALADLKQWAAYVDSQRPTWGEEQTYICTQCGERTPEVTDTSAYGFLCDRCFAILFA